MNFPIKFRCDFCLLNLNSKITLKTNIEINIHFIKINFINLFNVKKEYLSDFFYPLYHSKDLLTYKINFSFFKSITKTNSETIKFDIFNPIKDLISSFSLFNLESKSLFSYKKISQENIKKITTILQKQIKTETKFLIENFISLIEIFKECLDPNIEENENIENFLAIAYIKGKIFYEKYTKIFQSNSKKRKEINKHLEIQLRVLDSMISEEELFKKKLVCASFDSLMNEFKVRTSIFIEDSIILFLQIISMENKFLNIKKINKNIITTNLRTLQKDEIKLLTINENIIKKNNDKKNIDSFKDNNINNSFTFKNNNNNNNNLILSEINNNKMNKSSIFYIKKFNKSENNFFTQLNVNEFKKNKNSDLIKNNKNIIKNKNLIKNENKKIQDSNKKITNFYFKKNVLETPKFSDNKNNNYSDYSLTKKFMEQKLLLKNNKNKNIAKKNNNNNNNNKSDLNINNNKNINNNINNSFTNINYKNNNNNNKNNNLDNFYLKLKLEELTKLHSFVPPIDIFNIFCNTAEIIHRHFFEICFNKYFGDFFYYEYDKDDSIRIDSLYKQFLYFRLFKNFLFSEENNFNYSSILFMEEEFK